MGLEPTTAWTTTRLGQVGPVGFPIPKRFRVSQITSVSLKLVPRLVPRNARSTSSASAALGW